MDTALQRGVIHDGLEVDGEIVVGHEHDAVVEEIRYGGRADDAAPEHGPRHHGGVALVVLPREEQPEADNSPDDQTDDDGAVPCELVPAVLEPQEEHKHAPADEHEADEIQRLGGRGEHAPPMRLHLGLGNRVEEESDGDDGEEAEVEVEAPSPGGVDVGGEGAADEGTARDAELPKAHDGS